MIWNWSNVENVKTKRRKKDQLRFQIQVNLKASRIFRQFPLKILSILLSKQDKSKFNICDVLKYLFLRMMLFHDYLSTGRMINMIPKGNMAVLSKYTTAAIHLDILLDLIVSGNFQIQLKYLHWYINTGSSKSITVGFMFGKIKRLQDWILVNLLMNSTKSKSIY